MKPGVSYCHYLNLDCRLFIVKAPRQNALELNTDGDAEGIQCPRSAPLTGHSVGQEVPEHWFLIGCQHLGGVTHVRSDGKHSFVCRAAATLSCQSCFHMNERYKVSRRREKNLLMWCNNNVWLTSFRVCLLFVWSRSGKSGFTSS